MQRESRVTQMGADGHAKFSRATARDAKGKIVWPQGGSALRRIRWSRLPDAQLAAGQQAADVGAVPPENDQR